ncbi:MAG: DUF4912 domain-containing protein [Nitrospinae bacterium]|nr:DUF4912 domain-containing protein [Nitrospinota bacterium]
MTTIKKSDLKTSTKDELIKLGKKNFKLEFKPSETKEGILKKILKAHEADAKPAKKAVKSAPKKETTAVVAIKAKPSALSKVKAGISSVVARAVGKTKEVKAETKAKPAVKVEVKKQVEETRNVKPVASFRAEATPAPKSAKTVPVKKSAPATFKAPIFQSNIIGKPSLSNEENIEKSKFYIANVEEHIEAIGLPDRFEDNRIMLFVCDPFWVFTSWDLHPNKPTETARDNKINLAHFHKALRVYDVTDINFNGLNAHKHFDLDVNDVKGTWYINVPEDDRMYVVEVGLKNALGEFYVMARSNVVGTPRNGVSNRTDEEWMVADDYFWQMYALSGGFKARSGAASMELTEMMRQRLSGETSSGGLSSLGGSIRPKNERDKFWFRLDCELIVYGATEPDAHVTLLGKKVDLRPDGTFSARFALPDGIQVLDAKAVSANGKFEKTITPTVTRGTTVFQNKEVLEEVMAE